MFMAKKISNIELFSQLADRSIEQSQFLSRSTVKKTTFDMGSIEHSQYEYNTMSFLTGWSIEQS